MTLSWIVCCSSIPTKPISLSLTRRLGDSETRSQASSPKMASLTRSIYQRRFTSTSSRFNDSVTADVILTLHFESVDDDDVKLYLHSDVLLGKSRYFSAFLSGRWQRKEDDDGDSSSTSSGLKAATFNVPASMGSVVDTMTIFELFYSTDDDFSEAINTVSSALSIINTSLQLMFEDCVRACIRFLEAVSWSDEEEKRVLSLIPLLKPEESQVLLARIFPVTTDSSIELPYGLILEAMDPDNPNLESSKAFLSMLLRDFSSRDSARRALNQAFEANLKVLKDSLMYLSCPYFWTERENVQTAMINERHVTWLIEKMIELRFGETAVKEWRKQYFDEDVMEFFREYHQPIDNAALGVVAHVIRCTCKLADAVATGSIIADKQVRMKLVKDWLPVLIISNEKVLPIFAEDESTYQDLEKAFLRIISTLPMKDSQELLKKCIRLSTLNVEESPDLLSAFKTWFRRAAQQLSA